MFSCFLSECSRDYSGLCGDPDALLLMSHGVCNVPKGPYKVFKDFQCLSILIRPPRVTRSFNGL